MGGGSQDPSGTAIGLNLFRVLSLVLRPFLVRVRVVWQESSLMPALGSPSVILHITPVVWPLMDRECSIRPGANEFGMGRTDLKWL